MIQESCEGHGFTKVSLLVVLMRCDDCLNLVCDNYDCVYNHCCCGEEKVGCVQGLDRMLREENLACNTLGG